MLGGLWDALLSAESLYNYFAHEVGQQYPKSQHICAPRFCSWPCLANARQLPPQQTEAGGGPVGGVKALIVCWDPCCSPSLLPIPVSVPALLPSSSGWFCEGPLAGPLVARSSLLLMSATTVVKPATVCCRVCTVARRSSCWSPSTGGVAGLLGDEDGDILLGARLFLEERLGGMVSETWPNIVSLFLSVISCRVW